MTAGPPPVSIVIPARNEEALLPAALASVLAQDYGGTTEIIVADGSDTPAMAAAVAARFPAVRVIPNPERTTPAGLNRAVRAASHAVIVRCDARCVLPPDYVRLAVATLERTGAVVVGGRQRPVGGTAFEWAVSLALTTPLGAGDARWRLGGPEGPADTVYLGVFRRGTLEAVGGFDAALARNQDYELNWRLRERGETVWFDPALEVAYRPRGSLAQLARQYYGYGWWKRVMLRRHPASLRWRQLAPPLLVSGLAGSALLAIGAVAGGGGRPGTGAVLLASALVPLAWLLLLAAGAAVVGLRRRSAAALLLPLALAAMHLAWGTGFLLSSLAGWWPSRRHERSRGHRPPAPRQVPGALGGAHRGPAE